MSIGQWLAFGFGAAGVLLAVLVAFSFVSVARINELRRHEVESIAPRVETADQLEIAVLSRGVAARSFALTGSERALKAYDRAAAQVQEAVTRLEALPLAPEDPQSLEGLPESIADLAATTDDFITLAKVGSSRDSLRDVERRASAVREDLLERVRGFGAQLHAEQRQARGEILEAQRRMQAALTGISLLVLALIAATAVVTTRGVRAPALELLRSARRLSAGDYGPALELGDGRTDGARRRNELAELSSAFAGMAAALRAREERLSAGARLSSALASSLDAETLCDQALRELAGHLGADSGAVFLRAPRSEVFCIQSIHAPAGRTEPATGYELVREAAAKRAPVFSRAGNGRASAVPMLFQDRVLGVVQLGTRGVLDSDALAFLEQSASLLAVSVHNAITHGRVQELAHQLQSQNAQLQEQGEEIQAQNEELHSQNEELELQRGELQARGDELRGSVEALSRRDEDMREADRRKNEFLGVLSHELRNPLAPIRTSLFVLDRVAPGSDAARRAQAVIDRQVGQLSRLIDDLLDITRISRGKVRLQRAGLDLTRLVRQSADDYHPMFVDHGIHFELQVPERPLWVDGDPARLAQVVGNLLQNAAKFTPRGGHVALAVEEALGMVRVRVRDDGVGIPSEVLGRLFEPFVQADQTLARSGGGLGMGLALVKGLVELHGGTVRAASDGLGGGAEFAFELPIEEARPGAAPEPKRSPSRKRRVLIIEDNLDAAESLRDALQLDGFQVELAFDGVEGVRRVRELHPDVVLCDIGLPLMNGYEVARAVRADESLNEVFLVALTGYALPEDVRRAADAGFQQHLAKPPPIEKLEEVLGGPLH